MPGFVPFRGVRYSIEQFGDDLSRVGAPPYDVIDDDDRVALVERDPHNSVRLILPQDGSVEGDRYAAATALWREWIATGALVADSQPGFYTYRMEFVDIHGAARHTLGVIGAIILPAADGPYATAILPHERTLPKAKTDRLALLQAMRTNLDPIWGLSLTVGLTALLEPSEPLATMTDPNGVVHRLGVIRDGARAEAIAEAVAGSPLVLADGHHRYETAGNYRAARRAGGHSTPGEDAIMGFVVELTDDEVCIEAIHRLVDAPAVDVRAKLAANFTIIAIGANTPENRDLLEHSMTAHGGIGLADEHGLAVLVPEAAQAAIALLEEPAAVRDLDSAVVETLIVPALAGAEWSYRHHATDCAALVEKGVATAAFILRPPNVVQTKRVAEAGERMPQKTTFFSPKPRTGMVFRSLDDA